MRIAIGGIAHESNGFSSLKTQYEDFGTYKGEEMIPASPWDSYAGQKCDWAPTFLACGFPHGPVAKEAYLRIKSEILTRLKASLPVDGVYLLMHGAVEVEEIGDGESDLVGEIRECVGPDALISASLDLHGNIAPAFVEAADILTNMRTAPHLDDGPTRARAVRQLVRCLRDGIRPVSAFIPIPVLIPGEFAVTSTEPAKSLYGLLEKIDAIPGVIESSLFTGCAWTDSPFTSMSALVVAERDPVLAREQAQKLAAAVWEHRKEFAAESETAATADEAIARALAAPESSVFISDTGDNTTAGGAGDIPLFVERLLAAGVPDAVVAHITDAEAFDLCLRAGEGARISASIGGKLDTNNGRPLPVEGVVDYIERSKEPGCAVLKVHGVRIILTKKRCAFCSPADFARAGIDPLKHKIVVIKLGYLFPGLKAIAPRAILALTTGWTDLDMTRLPFSKIRRPMFPLDRNMQWTPSSSTFISPRNRGRSGTAGGAQKGSRP